MGSGQAQLPQTQIREPCLTPSSASPPSAPSLPPALLTPWALPALSPAGRSARWRSLPEPRSPSSQRTKSLGLGYGVPGNSPPPPPSRVTRLLLRNKVVPLTPFASGLARAQSPELVLIPASPHSLPSHCLQKAQKTHFLGKVSIQGELPPPAQNRNAEQGRDQSQGTPQ